MDNNRRKGAATCSVHGSTEKLPASTMKRTRSSIVLLSLIFGTGSIDANNEPERSEAPKLLRRIAPAPAKIGPIELDPHSQLAHKTKDMKIEPRIVGGTSTGPNVYPFFTRVDTSGFPYCGGSLVAPDIVLTAGHCWTSDDALSVVVNGYDLYSSEGPLQFDRDVNYSIRHPDFNSATYDNDALLLKLSSPVPDIQFVSLNFDDTTPQSGDDLIVMGLGNKEEDGGAASKLQAVTVQAVDHDTCEANYRDAGLDRVNDAIMLCAGNLVDGGRDVRHMKIYHLFVCLYIMANLSFLLHILRLVKGTLGARSSTVIITKLELFHGV